MHVKYVNKISAVVEVFVVYGFWERAHQGGSDHTPQEFNFSTLEPSDVCL